MANKLEQQKSIVDFKIDINSENMKAYESALSSVAYDERSDDEEKNQTTFTKTLKFWTDKKIVIPYLNTPVKVRETSEEWNFFKTESRVQKVGSAENLSLVPHAILSDDLSTVNLKINEQELAWYTNKDNRIDLLETTITVPKGTEVYRETADGKLEKVTPEK